MAQQYDGNGVMCYAGSFAMAARQLDPGLTYEQVLRCAGPARFECLTEDMEDAARRLGLRIRSYRSDFLFDGPPGGAALLWEPPGHPFTALRALVARGKVPLVVVDLHEVREARARAAPEFDQDLGRWGHIVAVTGYDPRHLYVNDPQMPVPGARDIPIPVETFRRAWAGGLAFLERAGPPVPEEEVFRETVREAGEALFVMDEWIGQLEASPAEHLHTLDHVTVAANDVKKRVLAAWLEERGQPAAARYYHGASRLYGRIRAGSRPAEVARILRQAAALEARAAALLGARRQAPQGWEKEPLFSDR